MTRIAWNAPKDRFFDAGLDRGVLYPKKAPALGPIVATNMMRNPGFVDPATGGQPWISYDGSDTAWEASWPGDLLHLVATDTPDTLLYGPDTDLPMTAGHAYTFQVLVRSTITTASFRLELAFKALNLASTGNAYSPYIPLKNGAAKIDGGIPPAPISAPVIDSGGPSTTTATTSIDGGTSSSTPTPVVGDWTLLTLTAVAPVGTTRAELHLNMSFPAEAGDIIDVSKGIVIEGPQDKAEYFDGSFTSGSYIFSWVGVPNNSYSTKQLIISSAVAWNGLTGVDEDGSDSASVYYLDGRPYLYLPKPKEYVATLKAFTYPDAFSELMGLAEAADGMYLDSQQSDSFDLSYRTLVGNGIDGVQHGYKIHLVYNAVVSPESLNYEALSSSINPVGFAWQIQAVPIPIKGFRPTAHVIIDTRHMGAEKIAQIEALLYGDADTVPGMPSPEIIFDILSFGESIIITNLGNGTWTAEGSYDNVSMIETGVFQINNVDAVDNLDGTFTISTTT